MPRLELKDLLYPVHSLQQELFITDFYNRFDNRSAANRYISNVELLTFGYLRAGSEFETYAANKLYLAIELGILAGAVSVAAIPRATLYDENNATMIVYQNNLVYWDGVQYRMCHNCVFIENVWFSRISFSTIDYMSFIGYRITLT